VPKHEVLYDNDNNFNTGVDIESIALEYGLQTLAVFDHEDKGMLPVYTADNTVVFKNKNDLSRVFDIEEDVLIQLKDGQFTFITQDTGVPWHLNRITKRELNLTTDYEYNTSGSCHRNKDVNIKTYIVDTGIDISHSQFQGRAKWGANFADETDTDCNSHGTHVAGLVGSKDFGVCVDAEMIAVKVLDCNGSGSLSGVIKGIEWVYKQHKQDGTLKANESRTTKSIINMSLGGGHSTALNRAVASCVDNDSDFFVVVAAGNENHDACSSSPAGVESVITVMASDSSDNRAYFSNWGKCANIYSPGVDIVSTVPDEKTASYSGTSMSSPVLAGVLNHYIDMNAKLNLTEIKVLLQETSTKNIIKGKKRDTVADLVYLTRP
jgi:subtilisin family serine protease